MFAAPFRPALRKSEVSQFATSSRKTPPVSPCPGAATTKPCFANHNAAASNSGGESTAAAPDSVSCHGSSPGGRNTVARISTLGSVEGTSHNCRRDWAPSMSTGPAIDAIGPQIATDEINNVAAKLSRNPRSAISLDMKFSSSAWLATQPALGRRNVSTQMALSEDEQVVEILGSH
jgi:hypothetical protein